MRSDLPSGTVTFLFTDVEGSTRLLHELGADTYAEALAEHRRAIRDACLAEGGVEVDTQGDGFFFVFPTAPGAVAAAAAFTDALTSGPIRVRVGLHTGTPLLTEEGYVGVDVHRAARIAAAGYGGQVLITASTADLVESPLVDLGEHRFKDLAAPERVYQLGDAAFPPLRSLYRADLPIPANPLVGRKKELVDVMRLLRDEARIVTVTGAGGVGKTRFAVAVAVELSNSFPGGVWFVPLAPLRDPALVLPTLGEVVGADGDLAGRFGDGECLVLVDNFEQVIDAGPGIAALLAECPGLRVLVTSRESLRVAGEREYALSPLPESPAVELFRQRVNAVAPDVAVEYAIAAQICDRLDRLPLAIELAAARMRALAPAQVLERLSKRLDLLKGGRDADPRQATLRATIAWSHDLLSSEEQELFAALSVFRGGCTLDAAEAVGGGDLDAVQSLVEKSLLRFTNGRYWMLETIQEYAGERLAGAPRESELRARHAAWYGDVAREGAMQWFGGRRAEGWEAKVDAEHDNIRAALAELQASGKWADLAATVVAVGGHWDTTGFGAEVDRWLGVALEQGLEDRLRARLLGLAGRRASFRGDREAALAHAGDFAEIAERLGDPMAIASATFDLARAHEVAGDAAAALGEYRRAAELFHGREPRSESAALANVVGLELDLGDYAGARQHALAALELARSSRYTDAIIGNTLHVATSFLKEGRVDEARLWLRTGFDEILAHDRVVFVADRLVDSAELELRERPVVAVELVAAARRLASETAIELLDESRDRGRAIEVEARATVGDAAVDDALAHGARLGWRDAVGVALAGLRG